MELVSEFFFDIFRRILPGLVTIFLWRKELAHVFAAHRFFSLKSRSLLDGHHDFSLVVFLVCILVAAWLVGVGLQRAMGFALAIAGGYLGPRGGTAFFREVRERLGAAPKQNEKVTGADGGHKKHRESLFALGEKEMSRSLAVIFLCSMSVHIHPDLRIEHHWPSNFSILASVAFLASWILGIMTDPDLNVDKPAPIRAPPFEIERKWKFSWGVALLFLSGFSVVMFLVGYILYGIIGLLLIILVWQRSAEYICPHCENPLESEEEKSCPACDSGLRPGKPAASKRR